MKQVVQSIVYLPYFIGWVVLVSVWQSVLGGDGLLNHVLSSQGLGPVNLMPIRPLFKPMMVLQYIWKNVGWGAIIFLAAISKVEPHLYEAAVVDGAGPWRRMWHVTLPGIRGIAVLLLILNLGNILTTGFEQILLQQPAVGAPAGEVLDTFVYFQGILGGNWGLSAAVGSVQGGRRHHPDRRRPTRRPTRWASRGCLLMAMRCRRRALLDGAPEPHVPSRQSGSAARIVMVMLFPFLYVLSVSLSSERDLQGANVSLIPLHPNLEAYSTILQGGVVTSALEVSIGVTAIGTLVCMVMTTTLAYGLSRTSHVPGTRFVLILVLGTLLFNAGIIPNYLLVRYLGLLNSYASLIVPGLDQRVQPGRGAPVLHEYPGRSDRRGHDRRRESVPDLLAHHPAAVQGGPGGRRAVLRRGVVVGLLRPAAVHQQHGDVADSARPAAVRAAGASAGRRHTGRATVAASGNHPDGRGGHRHGADSARLSIPPALLRTGGAIRRDQGMS